ncbi:MAG TPA: amino acid adenylation domain-containing protein, partial [Thermoanaerobaculia bacterium]|nr:amino acid adenylation domain-containing protein [Thermoanaerobaculia bacterium]
RRHEALRTTFSLGEDGEPVQVIAPAGPADLPVADLSGLPPATREAEGVRLAREEAWRPFDLAAGPLLRAALVVLGSEQHLVLLAMHHIVSDAGSMGILTRELAALYGAFSSRLPPQDLPLPGLPVQYADYAVWQRQVLRGETLAAQLAYWRSHLAGAPPVLALPTDRPRPAVQTFRGGGHSFALPPALAADLRTLALQRQATTFMTALAAFQALLSRWAGQPDVSLGTPIAGRGRSEVEGLIGLFLNTLVLRVRVDEEEPFSGLLRRVREVTLGAYTHQELPFEKLVEELQPQRDLAHSPLFQVMFTLEAEEAAPPADGLQLEAVPLGSGLAKFDLTLSLQESPHGIAGFAEYNRDLFDGTTIERMLGWFQVLLAAAAASPDLPLAGLPWMTGAERQQVTAEWSGMDAGVQDEALAPWRIARQAAAAPEAPAVGIGDAWLSYGELEAEARRLAGRLRRLGVGRGDRVAVLAERSPALVAALLGVWRTGAAYIPLDPSHPRERLAAILDDALGGVAHPVIVTDQDEVPGASATVLRVTDEDGPAPERDAVELSADDIAYVIYTSGSTGRPKGVEVRHGGLAAFLDAMARRPGLAAGDVLLAVTTVSFDIAALELFLPLAVGARVALASRETAGDGALLAEEVRRSGATMLQATPSTWRMLLSSGWQGAPGLTALCGGEALPADLATALLTRVGALWNVYGPTETTVWSTVHLVEAEDGTVSTVSIGRAIAGTTVHLLDRRFEPVPPGVVGDLFLGGAGLARGYLGRPDLTAAAFVPDPWGDNPWGDGARLYRTGDLARQRADGSLDFLGRADLQVKVRGVRIELEEIETVLRSHPGVREAAVVARPEPGGGASLLGCVVPGTETAPASATLRDFLRAKLPDSMVPSGWVFLQSLPLTPSGKVDRRALADLPPISAATPEGTGAEAPRGPVEEILAAAFAQVLRLGRVGRDDDFFALGGHSLLATRLIARIRHDLGTELPVRAVFEASTVAALSRLLERERSAAGAAPPLVPVPRQGDLPLSFAQERLWFVDQLQPGNAVYNLPMSVPLEEGLDPRALEGALGEVVRRHEALRTSFPAAGGHPVQRIAPAVGWLLPRVDLGGLPEERRLSEASRLAADEAARPFDLAAGPVLRSLLLVGAGGVGARLLLTMHHIAADAWSMELLVNEMETLYRAFASREPSPLPEPELQYADFAVWQRRWLAGAELERQLAYWRHRLAGAPPSLDLPTDRPRPAVQSYRGTRRVLRLAATLDQNLRTLAREHGSTLFMTVLAGVAALLSRWTGQDDLVIGTPIAGRGQVELERLIGFFANTLPLRVDAGGSPSFAELLLRVRDTALEAYAHQDLPFEKLVEELRVERDLSRPPVFQVVLSLPNTGAARRPAGDGVDGGPGLPAGGEEAAIARFDLTLEVREGPAGLDVEAEYATALFDGATIERLLGHLERLLALVARDPRQPAPRPTLPVTELPLLDPAELQQAIREWNDTAAPYPAEADLFALFAERARSAPDAVAVESGSACLSYSSLLRRATALARRLRQAGAGPESRIGLGLERSPEMVVALLAIVQVGGAYVPMDPALPQERLTAMAWDAGIEVLVAREPLLGFLAPFPLVEPEPLEEAEPGPDLPLLPEGGDRLAYVVFTSGSTGTPKGVAVPHRAVVRLVWETDYAAFGL